MTSTQRLYASAQNSFINWCDTNRIHNPTHDHIAQYLSTVYTTRGPSAVPVHLSAIASLFRAHHLTLDTKAQPIQDITTKARNAMRQTQNP
jgi:Phage integrase, N-terminal SAM-like domain